MKNASRRIRSAFTLIRVASGYRHHRFARRHLVAVTGALEYRPGYEMRSKHACSAGRDELHGREYRAFPARIRLWRRRDGRFPGHEDQQTNSTRRTRLPSRSLFDGDDSGGDCQKRRLLARRFRQAERRTNPGPKPDDWEDDQVSDGTARISAFSARSPGSPSRVCRKCGGIRRNKLNGSGQRKTSL